MLIELTAAQLLEMVVDGFVAAGAGKLTDAALPKLHKLWRKIRDRVAGHPNLPALPEVPTATIAAQVLPIIEAEWVEGSPFVEEVGAIAQDLKPLLQQARQQQTQQQSDRGGINVTTQGQSTAKVIGKIETQGDVNINF